MSTFKIKPSLNKGFGLFANHKTSRGDRISSEKPFLMVPKDIESFNITEFCYRFCRMSEWEKKSHLKLHAARNKVDLMRRLFENIPQEERQELDLDRIIKALAIFDTNSFTLDHPHDDMQESCRVFLNACCINHSCCPNTKTEWNARTGCLSVHAIKDIPIDEEITITYVTPYFERSKRQELLKRFDFTCTCPACDVALAMTEAGKNSENRRQRICRLETDLNFFFDRNFLHRIAGPLNTCFMDVREVEKQPYTAVRELAHLATQEDLTVARLVDWYVTTPLPSCTNERS